MTLILLAPRKVPQKSRKYMYAHFTSGKLPNRPQRIRNYPLMHATSRIQCIDKPIASKGVSVPLKAQTVPILFLFKHTESTNK